MLESVSNFISRFLQGSQNEIVLIILIVLISVFFFITLVLLMITLYLRISSIRKQKREIMRSRHWDPLILSVMDGSLRPKDAYEQLKWRNSIAYLLHLELYIDMVKGKEKERLLKLGNLSLDRLHDLIVSKNRKKRLYGVHLLGLFDRSEQSEYIKFDEKDIIYSLIMIREMRTVNDFSLKIRLIQMLFLFKYISPIYLSNILVDMGNEIIPVLKELIRDRTDHPYEQIVAFETLRRMHYSDGLDISDKILRTTEHPMVLTSCLRYVKEMGNDEQLEIVKTYIRHPHVQVRKAAVDAYISLAPDLDPDDVKHIFNDPAVKIAVSAAKLMQLSSNIPFLDGEEINELKWADIYKRMVF